MNPTIMNTSAPLLRGFGLAAIIFWIGASFAPLPAMLDGEDPNVGMEWCFFLTGALPFFVMYPLVMFMAKSSTRRIIRRKLPKLFGPLAGYAALWITLYPILS